MRDVLTLRKDDDPRRWRSALASLSRPLALAGASGRVEACEPSTLGGGRFCHRFGASAPYAVGAMAHGIASVGLVRALSTCGLWSDLGTAGLSRSMQMDALRELAGESGSWGANLVHLPDSPLWEAELAVEMVRYGAPRISLSAFTKVTLGVLVAAYRGLRKGEERARVVVLKTSRVDVLDQFLRPPPRDLLLQAVSRGLLDREEAIRAVKTPLIDALVIEGRSGGHTDPRPLSQIWGPLFDLCQRMAPAVLVGAAGGLGTPEDLLEAFGWGADFVMTGSLNQTTVEAGQSEGVKELLTSLRETDFSTAPAADMLELGAQVQVATGPSGFAEHAGRMVSLLRNARSLEELDEEQRREVEAVLGESIESAWHQTEAYWQERDPEMVRRAHKSPSRRFALLVRRYLGLSSRWALQGDLSRREDWQIWSGPAVARFEGWVSGSWLQPLSARRVSEVSWTLLRGTCYAQRVQWAEALGWPVPPDAKPARPWRDP